MPPTRSLLRRFARFWEEDRGLSLLLVLLVVFILTGGPLARLGVLGQTVRSLLMSLALGSGVLAVSGRRWTALTAGCIAAVAIATEWAGGSWPTPALEAAAALSAVACVSLLAAVVLHQVLRTGRINVHRVVGSAAAYLLLGFAWGELYRALSAFVPGALASAAGVPLERAQFHYFSFITLTTVGYGDITPLHPFARSLAMLEALTGQLFPVILIARLVSMELLARDHPGD